MLLYYITARTQFPGREAERRAALLARIAEAAHAGVDYIQLREKDLNSGDLASLARAALARIRANSSTTRLIINSRTAVALGTLSSALASGYEICWSTTSGFCPSYSVTMITCASLKSGIASSRR